MLEYLRNTLGGAWSLTPNHRIKIKGVVNKQFAPHQTHEKALSNPCLAIGLSQRIEKQNQSVVAGDF